MIKSLDELVEYQPIIFVLPFEEGSIEAAKLKIAALEIFRKWCGHVSFGTATGDSMRHFYRYFTNSSKFSLGPNDNIIMLDNFLGTEEKHPGDFRFQTKENILNPLGAKESQFFSPPNHIGVTPSDLKEFDRQIIELGVHVQVYGMGINGHAAYLEPSKQPVLELVNQGTSIIELEEGTRRGSVRKFGKLVDVPKFSSTQGPYTLLRALLNIVIVNDVPEKAEPVRQAIEEEISAMCSISFLRYARRAVWFISPEAASKLTNKSNIRTAPFNPYALLEELGIY